MPFQVDASTAIAGRYMELSGSDDRPFETRGRPVPFYQTLSALTGAGKTPILADAVQQIRGALTVEPFVLWLSKGKVVIDQTAANFDGGGKYARLIDGFSVLPFSDLTVEEIRDGSRPLLALATVGTFNQEKKGAGSLRIYKVKTDSGGEPMWDTIKARRTQDGTRRPLIIVYDESHNLSDQQVDLLLELEPDAFLTASATMKTPGRLGRVIDRLKETGWGEKLATRVASKDVVEAELIKRQVVLGGYLASMEIAIDHMLDLMAEVSAKADELETGIAPKAIYVSQTNVAEESGEKDNPKRPFDERRAPPILIWRYLVEGKGIDPSDIAVYCDLAVDRYHPLPDTFCLFNKGDDDYATFRDGGYRHIIFNQSLQEGWDDPECYFAYIDKGMQSTVQIEQVIGRVLRQPNATHYAHPDLNTAHFYIRYDEATVFPTILAQVGARLRAESPDIVLTAYEGSDRRQRDVANPKSVATVPHIYIDAQGAKKSVATVIDTIHDYAADTVNTVGRGTLERVMQTIGTGEQAKVIAVSVIAHTNRVRARRILIQEIERLYPRAEGLFPSEKVTFDALVEMSSKATGALRKAAEEFVDAYLEHVVLMYDEDSLYTAGPVYYDPDKSSPFQHALHAAYSGLNTLELDFAQALDDTGYTWVRNPASGGYGIPLLRKGKGPKNFYPDFLVWRDDTIFALDTKGDHLIMEAAGSKMLDIAGPAGTRRVVVRLITQGKWNKEPIKPLGGLGYSVWTLKHGLPHPTYCEHGLAEVVEAALE